MSVSSVIPPCVQSPEPYLDDAGEPTSSMSRAERNRRAATRAQLHQQCAACPLMFECLYRAVVEVDVDGYAACTTEADRVRMRRQLGIDVSQSALTPYGAPRVGGGRVSHEAVLSARHSHPKDTCQQLAERLGCSTSTVKRHLRRERQRLTDASAEVDVVDPRPTLDEVLDAFDVLLGSSRAA